MRILLATNNSLKALAKDADLPDNAGRTLRECLTKWKKTHAVTSSSLKSVALSTPVKMGEIECQEPSVDIALVTITFAKRSV